MRCESRMAFHRASYIYLMICHAALSTAIPYSPAYATFFAAVSWSSTENKLFVTPLK